MFEDFTELTLHKYMTNIYLCWEFALLTSTLLSIFAYFKRFQLNNLLSQLPNWSTFFDKLLIIESYSHSLIQIIIQK